MLNYFQDNDKTQCCGCRACEQICVQQAIVFLQDEEGFLYPSLNEALCTNCGLCEKVCPIANVSLVLNGKINVYAVQNRNKQTLKKSSSGGVFSIIAEKVLNNGGIIYGAAFDHEMILSHRSVSKIDELSALRGSKYLQSDTKDTFIQVKQNLKQGRQVYYTGTPCQIAGLKLFLRKEYNNLITSDLVCHGTPSQKIFSIVVSQIEKEKNGKIVEYSFRDKKHGWSCSSSSSSIKRNDKSKYIPYNINMEAYFNAFMQGYLYQRVCYECPFARPQRTGDISLADYWGIKKLHPEFPAIQDGVSLILINTEKGARFWQDCVGNVVQIESEMPINYNPNLRQPSPYSPEREVAYDLAFNNYEQFRRKYAPQKSILNRLKFYVQYIMRNKMPFVYNLLKKMKK